MDNITNLSTLQCAEHQMERVNSFKLLALHLDADFSWHSHVETITSKVTKLNDYLHSELPQNFPES